MISRGGVMLGARFPVRVGRAVVCAAAAERIRVRRWARFQCSGGSCVCGYRHIRNVDLRRVRSAPVRLFIRARAAAALLPPCDSGISFHRRVFRFVSKSYILSYLYRIPFPVVLSVSSPQLSSIYLSLTSISVYLQERKKAKVKYKCVRVCINI